MIFNLLGFSNLIGIAYSNSLVFTYRTSDLDSLKIKTLQDWAELRFVSENYLTEVKNDTLILKMNRLNVPRYNNSTKLTFNLKLYKRNDEIVGEFNKYILLNPLDQPLDAKENYYYNIQDLQAIFNDFINFLTNNYATIFYYERLKLIKGHKSIKKAIKEKDKVISLATKSDDFIKDSNCLLYFPNLKTVSVEITSNVDLEKLIYDLKKSNLEELYLTGSYIEKLPENIGELTSLIRLGLQNTNVSILPESLCNLDKLTELHFCCNKIQSLPTNMNLLTNLEIIYLNDNELKFIPESINKLNKLWYLDLSNNNIQKTDYQFEYLTNLKFLFLHNNQIVKIEKSINYAESLNYITLHNNKLIEVPENLLFMNNLWFTSIENNPIDKDKIYNFFYEMNSRYLQIRNIQ